MAQHEHDPYHPESSYEAPVVGAVPQLHDSFRAERWGRLGVTTKQLIDLEEKHNKRTIEERIAHNEWVDSRSDPELADSLPSLKSGSETTDPAQLTSTANPADGNGIEFNPDGDASKPVDPSATADVPGPESPNPAGEPVNPSHPLDEQMAGSVASILAKVGSDKTKAQAALEYEQAKETPRTSLVGALGKIIG